MTQEEFDKLPFCIRYKDSDKDCRKLHSDDWDELEDCCSSCLGNKHFAKKYYEHSFMDHSYDEIMSNMR